jgi:PAS domain S-box-containing protein
VPGTRVAAESDRLLRAVRETHVLLASSRDVVTASRVVAERVVDMLDAAAALVCVPNAESGLRLVCATRCWAEDADPGAQFAIGVCDKSWKLGQPITQDARAGCGARTVQSVSAVPVRALDRVVAVIGVGWSSARDGSGSEHDALSLMASPLGPALEALRLASDLERSTRVAEAMGEFLCRDMRGTLREEDVEQLALRLATRVLRPHSAAIWLLHADQSVRYGAGVAYPLAPDGQVVPLNEGLMRQAALDVVNLTDVPIEAATQHPAFARRTRCAYLGVPIQRHGVSLGAFEVIGEAGRQFSNEEEALLTSLASGVAIGVTSAREASELEHEERRLAAVLEQLPSGVLVLDRAGRPVLMNSACRRIFGQRFDPDRSVAEQAADLDLRRVPDEEHMPAGALLGRVLAGEEIRTYEATFRPAGAESEHWLQASAVPLRDSSTAIVGGVVVVTDVTHERRLAGDLAATVRQNLYLHGALAESERRLEDMIEHLLRPRAAPRPAAVDRQLDTLTPREREVLGLLGEGKSTDDMMRELQLSAGTVRLHVKHVLAKLGVSSRTQAALRARELAHHIDPPSIP